MTWQNHRLTPLEIYFVYSTAWRYSYKMMICAIHAFCFWCPTSPRPGTILARSRANSSWTSARCGSPSKNSRPPTTTHSWSAPGNTWWDRGQRRFCKLQDLFVLFLWGYNTRDPSQPHHCCLVHWVFKWSHYVPRHFRNKPFLVRHNIHTKIITGQNKQSWCYGQDHAGK